MQTFLMAAWNCKCTAAGIVAFSFSSLRFSYLSWNKQHPSHWIKYIETSCDVLSSTSPQLNQRFQIPLSNHHTREHENGRYARLRKECPARNCRNKRSNEAPVRNTWILTTHVPSYGTLLIIRANGGIYGGQF